RGGEPAVRGCVDETLAPVLHGNWPAARAVRPSHRSAAATDQPPADGIAVALGVTVSDNNCRIRKMEPHPQPQDQFCPVALGRWRQGEALAADAKAPMSGRRFQTELSSDGGRVTFSARRFGAIRE